MLLQSIITIWSFKTLLSSALSGKATYYGGNENGGACGYDEVPSNTFPYGYYAAAGGSTFDSGYGCGKCFTVKCVGPYSYNPSCYCSDATVTIQVMDQCPECDYNHLDLNPKAMAAIVGDGLSGTCGVIEIEYEAVDCDYSRNFQVRNKGGTSQWWYGLHLDYVGGYGGVSGVTLYDNKGSYEGKCTKDNGPSFWICTASSGEFTTDGMTIILTAGNGDSLTASGCITSLDGGAENICDVNFGSSSGGGTATPKPTPAPTTNNNNNTPKPTPSPVDSSGGSGGKVTITNKNGLNQWWYAVVITDSDGNYMDDTQLQYVKMKDGNMNGYENGVNEWDYWKFTGNTPYSPDFTFKLKSSITNEVIQTSGSIGSLNEGDYTEISSGFSSSYTEDNDEENKLSWGAWFAIIFCILLIIACIIIGTFCYIKRQKQKGQVEFDEKYQVGDTPTNAGTNDKQTETQQEVEEIEVEMDMETR